AADPPPGHQLAGPAHAAAGVMVTKAEHPGQATVHRRRRPATRARLQHDHVSRRGPQPCHEPARTLHPRISPADPGLAQELKPQPQAGRVSPHRVRRALQRAQVSQIPHGRDHDSTIVADHSPRLDTGNGHQDTLNMHICSLFRLGSHLKANRCPTVAAIQTATSATLRTPLKRTCPPRVKTPSSVTSETPPSGLEITAVRRAFSLPTVVTQRDVICRRSLLLAVQSAWRDR